MTIRSIYLTAILIFTLTNIFCQDQEAFETELRPLLAKKCFECHDTGNPKGGVNLDNYKEVGRVISDGRLWLKVLDQIKTRSMPPKTEKPLSEEDYHQLVTGINDILQSSLKQKSPDSTKNIESELHSILL